MQIAPLSPPNADDAPALSLEVTMTTDGLKTCDLASLTNFTGNGQPKVTPLTDDGTSCDPAWR